jgi:hypothetical protein
MALKTAQHWNMSCIPNVTSEDFAILPLWAQEELINIHKLHVETIKCERKWVPEELQSDEARYNIPSPARAIAHYWLSNPQVLQRERGDVAVARPGIGKRERRRSTRSPKKRYRVVNNGETE